MEKISFPKGFLWGVATAAYQVEGFPLADGAGPSNWHIFSHKKGVVMDGTNGDAACEQYRRLAGDIASMRDMGVKAYRFSVGWARLFPRRGRPNPLAIDHYSRLVDDLLAAGIEPWLTIFHFEEPLWLVQEGGFTRRSSVDRLVELGVLLFQHLGDRVRNWITVNEPSIYAYLGFMTGEFPPGRRLALRSMMHSAHHLLLAHARLCDAWKGTGRPGAIGVAHHSLWVEPARRGHARDIEAAAMMDDIANRSILDPILKGTYPGRVLRRMGLFLPRSLDRDLVEMHQPGSFVGINYYARNLYRWSALLPFLHAREHVDAGAPRSAMWAIYPAGLRESLLRLKNDYGNPPCFVTENGFPLPEVPGRDPLDDPERIAYLRDHIAMAGRAIAQGVDCRGYFHWSLLDNFEWNKGLSMRFGLMRTDFTSQERRWRKSAHWYKELIRTNSLEGAAPA